MTNKLLRVAIAVGLAAALIVVGEPHASGHDPATQYSGVWPAPSAAVQYSFTPSVPSAFRSGVTDGVQPWNARGERNWFFQGPDVADFPSHPTCPAVNGIHYVGIDGPNNIVAQTWTCFNQLSQIVAVNIDIDSAESWYTGTGSPGGSQVDLRSALTHEWGHATGANHFGADVCFGNNAANQTMCPNVYSGTTYPRSLETHDIHTFENAYPPTWFLSNANPAVGTSVTPFGYGSDADSPVACDWDGDGDSTAGVYRAPFFYLRNSNSEGPADVVAQFGVAGDRPICGDWNGDGVDTIGVYRSSSQTFFMNDQNDASAAEYGFVFGSPGDSPLAGNWDGSFGANSDTVGVYSPSGQLFFLKTFNDSSSTNIGFVYGSAGDYPVSGNWNGTTTDRTDTIGIFRQGTWFLNDQNDSSGAEYGFVYGGPSDFPVIGNWDGTSTNKSDTTGLVRGL